MCLCVFRIIRGHLASLVISQVYFYAQHMQKSHKFPFYRFGWAIKIKNLCVRSIDDVGITSVQEMIFLSRNRIYFLNGPDRLDWKSPQINISVGKKVMKYFLNLKSKYSFFRDESSNFFRAHLTALVCVWVRARSLARACARNDGHVEPPSCLDHQMSCYSAQASH